jgi:hypothetical protein
MKHSDRTQYHPRRGHRPRGAVIASGALIAAACVTAASASALAAPSARRGNYHGPARSGHVAVIVPATNYLGPARTTFRAIGTYGSNSNRPEDAVRTTQRGSK